ncbi:MAG: CDP-alcohol phosphatidyltransferase family protein [Polyangia bacterium]
MSIPDPPGPASPPGAATLSAALPNLLSLSRIGLAAVLWKVRERPTALLSLMGIAAVTDLLDGWFARHDQPLSQRLGLHIGEGTGATGEWLDPLCDKVFVVSLLAALLVERRISAEQLALIGLRDVAVTPLILLYRFSPALRERVHLSLKARRLGKLTTVAQFVTVAAALVAPRSVPKLALGTAGLGLAAVADYVYRAAQQWQRSRPAP